MRKAFITIIGLLIFSWAFGQEPAGYTLVKTESYKADFFTSDQIGNVYLVRKDELRMYDNQGNLLYTYSDKVLGEISSVDVLNPFKIQLFYDGYAQLVFLDNRLSRTADPVYLAQIGHDQATLTAASHSSGLWLYNPINFELMRFDRNLQIEHQTGNISQITGTEIRPDFILERNDWVYLNNPKTGILVFDIYGTYYKTIPVQNLSAFQVTDKYLFYVKDNQLNTYHLRTFDQDTVPVPEKHFRQAMIRKNRLYLLTDDGFKIYERK